MKALCWHGTGDVRVDTVADPTIQDPHDIVIKITSTAICGSDLHLFNGFQPTMEKGDQLGHENMGEVVEIGSGISTQAGEQTLLTEEALPAPNREGHDHPVAHLHT